MKNSPIWGQNCGPFVAPRRRARARPAGGQGLHRGGVDGHALQPAADVDLRFRSLRRVRPTFFQPQSEPDVDLFRSLYAAAFASSCFFFRPQSEPDVDRSLLLPLLLRCFVPLLPPCSTATAEVDLFHLFHSLLLLLTL